MSVWHVISQRIAAATGAPFHLRGQRQVGGGSINSAYVVDGDAERYFVKLNSPSRVAMFAAEAEGLEALAASGGLRVPAPVCWGEAGGHSFIVLEHIPLGGGITAHSLEALGRGLAAVHRSRRESFGWHRDNTIGSTPQNNAPERDWVVFWRRHRLGYQLDLAARNGFRGEIQDKGRALMEALPALLADHRPQPSLLHGDLWGGNWAADSQGEPVIFDPAVYYGDREADLAMTELFGGFGPRFYAAYQEAWPPPPGYAIRKILYNLYHVLNHANLFGGGYAMQAETMMDRLLAEIR
jgi:fructosamine-3-kinase